jgi:flagellar secretion chaperone FliS
MTYASPASNRYLDGRVATASQPELQLMLLDGALRFGRLARPMWGDAARQIEADRLVTRARDIVEELVRSVSGGATPQSARLEEEYAFIFRQLATAQVGHDAAAFDSALELLAYQRETWRQACEKLKPANQPAPMPNLNYAAAPAGGFSFQA